MAFGHVFLAPTTPSTRGNRRGIGWEIIGHARGGRGRSRPSRRSGRPRAPVWKLMSRRRRVDGVEVDATISARTLTLSVESWARSPSQNARGRDRSLRASVDRGRHARGVATPHSGGRGDPRGRGRVALHLLPRPAPRHRLPQLQSHGRLRAVRAADGVVPDVSRADHGEATHLPLGDHTPPLILT